MNLVKINFVAVGDLANLLVRRRSPKFLYALLVGSLIVWSMPSLASDYLYDPRFNEINAWLALSELQPYVENTAKGNIAWLRALTDSQPDVVQFPLFGGMFYAIEQINNPTNRYDLEFFRLAYGDGQFLARIMNAERIKRLQEITNELVGRVADEATTEWLEQIQDALDQQLKHIRSRGNVPNGAFPKPVV